MLAYLRRPLDSAEQALSGRNRREHGDDLPAVFLICRSHIRASLAAGGSLRSTGRLRPIIVEGGMELWEAQGFADRSLAPV